MIGRAIRFFPALGVMVASVLSAGGAVADPGITTRVSVDSSGAQGNGDSFFPFTSADGRFVTFHSDASNLVAGDTNGFNDVFVHDRATGITTRVSVDSSGAQGNGSSALPAISADGRFVAFHSIASNLVPSDTNADLDVFVHDMVTGITTRVSADSSGAQGNGSSGVPTISADGRFVAFESSASNLVAGDTNFAGDVFVHDLATGATTRVSVNSAGAEGSHNSGGISISMSADGRFVAFRSFASNLVAGDSNGFVDVFVHDRATGVTTRESVDSAGAEGNEESEMPSISADGRFVAFRSFASNLVAGDSNGFLDVFVHDRVTGATTRVSVDSSGDQGNSFSDGPAISANGLFVAFGSFATNLVAEDTNGVSDVFVHDRATGITTRVSVDSSGAQGNGDSMRFLPSISADGRFVAFESNASNLVGDDTNSIADVFVHDRGPHDLSLVAFHSRGPRVGNGRTKTHVVVVQNAGVFSPDGAVVSLAVTSPMPACSAQVDDPTTSSVETGSSLAKMILLGAGDKAHVSFLVTYSCSNVSPNTPEFELTADVEDVHGQDADPGNDAPIVETQDVRD